MDMSLIAGMPEVIAYIRSQDERIKALKEECRVQKQMRENVWEVLEKLKEENERLEARVEMYAEHNKKLNRDMEESEKYDWEKKYHHINTRFIALENIEKKLKDSI